MQLAEAASRVTDQQARVFSRRGKRDADGSAIAVKLHGVIHEIQPHLAPPTRIGGDSYFGRRVRLDGKADPLRLSQFSRRSFQVGPRFREKRQFPAASSCNWVEIHNFTPKCSFKRAGIHNSGPSPIWTAPKFIIPAVVQSKKDDFRERGAQTLGSKIIQRTGNLPAHGPRKLCINLGRAYIRMAEQLLH